MQCSLGANFRANIPSLFIPKKSTREEKCGKKVRGQWAKQVFLNGGKDKNVPSVNRVVSGERRERSGTFWTWDQKPSGEPEGNQHRKKCSFQHWENSKPSTNMGRQTGKSGLLAWERKVNKSLLWFFRAYMIYPTSYLEEQGVCSILCPRCADFV